MANVIRQIWRSWKIKRQRRTVKKYLEKRSAILKEGLHIFADVQDCCVTCISSAQLRLVRLRLSIPIKDNISVETISTAFIATDAKQLISKRLRIRFLPGDLSHVVITG
ncbi:MAG: hypothetical protein EOO46_24290 [Flavobacterium sp.]|nr:MAG: hypothetical protein EOO46_24290 [Flavobacterium sp.]